MWFRRPDRQGKARLLLGGLLLAPLLALAAQTPNDQLPYEIQADSAVFDQQQGTGEYQGHVQLKRGAEQLKASNMLLTLDKQKQLTHVEATGSPVTFTDGVDMQGRAERLVYDVKARTVRLLGKASVTQGQRQFSGAEIVYALDSKRVQAKGGDGKRVRLVLPPADTEKGGAKGDKK